MWCLSASFNCYFACVDCRSTCISSTIITRIHFSWWKAIYWLDSKWFGFIHTSRTHELAEHGDHVSSVYLMFWKCKISQSSHNNTRYTEQEWTYRLADLIIDRKRNSANIWICITNNRKNCISSHSRTPLTEYYIHDHGIKACMFVNGKLFTCGIQNWTVFFALPALSIFDVTINGMAWISPATN